MKPIRLRLPVNGADHRPHFLANHEDPYICGQCGHSCSSVDNQAAHLNEEHYDFMAEGAEVTGIHEGPQAVLYMVDHAARHHYQCTYFVGVDLLLQYYVDA